MKKRRITIGTEPNPYVKVHGSVPALLWGEIVEAVSEYRKFELGCKGTRFDPWLKKKSA